MRTKKTDLLTLPKVAEKFGYGEKWLARLLRERGLIDQTGYAPTHAGRAYGIRHVVVREWHLKKWQRGESEGRLGGQCLQQTSEFPPEVIEKLRVELGVPA